MYFVLKKLFFGRSYNYVDYDDMFTLVILDVIFDEKIKEFLINYLPTI